MTVVCKEVCEIRKRKIKTSHKYVVLTDKRESGIVIKTEQGREREIGNEGRCRRVGYIH